MQCLFSNLFSRRMGRRALLATALVFHTLLPSVGHAQFGSGSAVIGTEGPGVPVMDGRAELFVYDPAKPRPVRSEMGTHGGHAHGGIAGMPGGSGMMGSGAGMPGIGMSGGYGSSAGGMSAGDMIPGGGESGGMTGESGMGGPRQGVVVVSPNSILIQAVIAPQHTSGERDKIELKMQNPEQLAMLGSQVVSLPSGMGGGMSGGMSGYGSSMGMEGGAGYGGAGDVGIPFDTPLSTEVYNREQARLAKQNGRSFKPLLDGELENAGALIKLQLWRETAMIDLKVTLANGNPNDEDEKFLKEILREEYDALLNRQRLELTRVERRVKEIQADIARRAAARDRVIDVQLGKIVLESQGLLNTK